MGLLKGVDDYTYKELAMMNDEELQRLVDLECMVSGVIKPESLPELQEEPSVPEPDLVVYNIDNFYFTNKQDALDVLDLLLQCRSICRIDWTKDYKYPVKRNIPPTIESLRVYDQKVIADMQEVFKHRDSIRPYNKQIQDACKESGEEYQEICDEVYKKYYDAVQKYNRFIAAQNLYVQYKELSNGCSEIAKNFFMQSDYAEFWDEIIK